MEPFRAKGELVGDINLKVRRAVNGTSGGKKQMLMPGEINDRSEVEGRVAAPAVFAHASCKLTSTVV